MLQLGHKKLRIYKIALDLVKEVYKLTKQSPSDERFALISQLRRAAISVCSNIVEGASRKSTAERKRFYEISRGSCVEIDTQFEIALILEYLQQQEIKKLEEYLESTFRMICRMIDNTGN